MQLPEVRPITGTAEEIARADSRVARGMLSNAIDVHTHLWPEGFYRAICDWFDEHAWRIRFRGTAEEAIDVLRRAGTQKNVALVYAHKPGVARILNSFLGEVCRADPSVLGVGTVMPGETDARAIVREAITVHGLRGIKLHCHVQCISIDEPRTMEVLEECALLGVPAVVHAGREPRLMTGYGIDPHVMCGAARTENVLRALPGLVLVIPHLGLDEVTRHFELLSRYENLHLDTAMTCAEYFEVPVDFSRIAHFSDRVLYGTDFPIIPFEAPNRELHVLARRIESDEAFERIARGNAMKLWQL